MASSFAAQLIDAPSKPLGQPALGQTSFRHQEIRGKSGCYWLGEVLEKRAPSRSGYASRWHLGKRAGLPSSPPRADMRDVLVEGQSGILAVAPPWFRPIYEPSKRRLTWPNGGNSSAAEPGRLRGRQQDAAICDELAAWSRPETLDMLQFGLRLDW
jgi:hypothetical protein